MHELMGRHLVNGRWVESRGAKFTAVDPAAGETLQPEYSDAGEAEVEQAARTAAEAMAAAMDHPPRWQAELLEWIAAKVMEQGDALLERGERETALPRARLEGERLRTVNQLRMFAEVVREGSWVEATIDTADPERKPQPKPDLRRMLRPRGPVAVFGASNFPFAFGAVGGDTASALAGGNPVIVKGHPSHPGTSELFAAAVASALEELDLPRGLFALLQGRGHTLSQALVKHPDIAAVGFTGSLKAGRALFDIAAARERPIPIYAEMGSTNPLFILPGAMAERSETIARELAGSVLLSGGQFCTKPGLIFTIGRDDKLVRQLAEQIKKHPPVTMLNQGLRESFRARRQTLAGAQGVRSVVDGGASGHAAAGPSLFQTGAAAWRREPALHEEVFGPAALVVHCDSVDEAIACIDNIGGSLTGTVQMDASDGPDAAKLLRRLEPKVGRVIVNGYPTGVEVCHAIVHGGPYPATTDPGSTSVGTAAMRRFVRMVAYQNAPQDVLPPALRDENPLEIERVVDGRRTREAIAARQG
jgi:2,5-dioxopentanoate dehydrogenase